MRASVNAQSEFTAKRAYSGGAPRTTVPAQRPASAPPLRRRAYAPAAKPKGAPLPAHLRTAYDQFYNALMEAIVKERMYQEEPLRRLFHEFVKSSGGDMQQVVFVASHRIVELLPLPSLRDLTKEERFCGLQVAERVVAQLAAELDVRAA